MNEAHTPSQGVAATDNPAEILSRCLQQNAAAANRLQKQLDFVESNIKPNLRILLIGGTELNIVQRFLSVELQHDVQFVSREQEALIKLQNARFDMVVFDQRIQHLGVLLRHVREIIKSRGRTALVVVSPQPGVPAADLSAEVDSAVKNPMTLKEFMDVVRSIGGNSPESHLYPFTHVG